MRLALSSAWRLLPRIVGGSMVPGPLMASLTRRASASSGRFRSRHFLNMPIIVPLKRERETPPLGECGKERDERGDEGVTSHRECQASHSQGRSGKSTSSRSPLLVVHANDVATGPQRPQGQLV